jgi:predicted 3-demethylubiquinone-9 3-methyltransferase (glyoxalase superfamily)
VQFELILGGAAVHRCGNCTVLIAALAAEGRQFFQTAPLPGNAALRSTPRNGVFCQPTFSGRSIPDNHSPQQRKANMQKITPFLWFDGQAEEAANFYTSIFKNSKILNIARYGEAGPGPKGTVMVATFQLEGQQFMALNGGPHYTFTPAISFFVDCETQAEVDELWEKLSAGGSELQCAWLKDKFGVSWQIVPRALIELMQDKDPLKSQRVFKAMLQMTKIDIEGLKRAYRGE